MAVTLHLTSDSTPWEAHQVLAEAERLAGRVPPAAYQNFGEVKTAFRRIMIAKHPDKVGAADKEEAQRIASAAGQAVAILEAYEGEWPIPEDEEVTRYPVAPPAPSWPSGVRGRATTGAHRGTPANGRLRDFFSFPEVFRGVFSVPVETVVEELEGEGSFFEALVNLFAHGVQAAPPQSRVVQAKVEPYSPSNPPTWRPVDARTEHVGPKASPAPPPPPRHRFLIKPEELMRWCRETNNGQRAGYVKGRSIGPNGVSSPEGRFLAWMRGSFIVQDVPHEIKTDTEA